MSAGHLNPVIQVPLQIKRRGIHSDTSSFYGNVAIHGYNAQRVAVCIPLAAGTPESGCISDFATGEGNAPAVPYGCIRFTLDGIGKNFNHLQVPIAVLLQGNACKQ